MSMLIERIAALDKLGLIDNGEDCMAKTKWETVDHDGGEGETRRLRVHNGWLIVNRWRSPDGSWLQSLHYFKDEKWEWKL